MLPPSSFFPSVLLLEYLKSNTLWRKDPRWRLCVAKAMKKKRIALSLRTWHLLDGEEYEGERRGDGAMSDWQCPWIMQAALRTDPPISLSSACTQFRAVARGGSDVGVTLDCAVSLCEWVGTDLCVCDWGASGGTVDVGNLCHYVSIHSQLLTLLPQNFLHIKARAADRLFDNSRERIVWSRLRNE